MHLVPDRCLIRWWRRATWHEQTRRLQPHSPTAYAERGQTNPALLGWVHRLWKRRALVLERMADRPPWSLGWLDGALCVHGLEGSWTVPYGLGPQVSGGMQIGLHEWHYFGGGRFAPEAYLASPLEQLLVAWRYTRVSGWGPWPNTARACGLL